MNKSEIVKLKKLSRSQEWIVCKNLSIEIERRLIEESVADINKRIENIAMIKGIRYFFSYVEGTIDEL